MSNQSVKSKVLGRIDLRACEAHVHVLYLRLLDGFTHLEKALAFGCDGRTVHQATPKTLPIMIPDRALIVPCPVIGGRPYEARLKHNFNTPVQRQGATLSTSSDTKVHMQVRLGM
jgi:hypothetical protein